jgi:hypothetical protein
MLQPNHYFHLNTNYARIEGIANLAHDYYEGVEMEFDEGVMFNADLKNRFYNYLKGGIEFSYMTDALKGWYQDVYGIYNLYKNKDNNGITGIFDGRQIYDDIYRFIKGSYTIPDNLAKNKPAFSSSNETAALSADKAADNLYYTRWSSQYTDSEWIYVDLGQEYNIDRVKLDWESSYGLGYKIQVSNDAVNWTDAYTTTTGDGGVDEIRFAPVNARYVRMYGTQRGTSCGYSLYEFEVYERNNLAIAKPVTSSIYIDLEQLQSVNYVKLNWGNSYLMTYKIQVSTDSVNWLDVYETSTGDGGIDEINFTSANARYVRVCGTGTGLSTLLGFEIYKIW